MSEISLEDYKKAYREIKKEEAKRGFTVHLVIYIVVNVLLMIINLLYSPQVLWFFYPLICWGIGILMHYLYGIYWLEKEIKELEAKVEYRAKEQK